MIREPTRRWFLIPLPAALLVTCVLCLVRTYIVYGTLRDIPEWVTIIVPIGIFFFPLGLAGAVLMPADVIAKHALLIVAVVYLSYLALILRGRKKPGRALLFVFCILLVLNIIGCQMKSIERSLETCLKMSP